VTVNLKSGLNRKFRLDVLGVCEKKLKTRFLETHFYSPAWSWSFDLCLWLSQQLNGTKSVLICSVLKVRIVCF